MSDGVQDVEAGGSAGRDDRRGDTRNCGRDQVQQQIRHRDVERPDEIVGHDGDRGAAKNRSQQDAEHPAEPRDYRPFEEHHPQHLLGGHANGTYQAELAGPLKNRQSQGDGDSKQGDHDRNAHQHIDHDQGLIDLAGLAILELVPGFRR